jgi:AcrR family transcriptional regulator
MSMAGEKTRAKISDALLELLATRDLADIGLADIAKQAGVSPGTLRDSFDGKVAILANFSRRIDDTVLAGETPEDETPRDRLFEIFMRRFDALRPYAPGLKGLARSARRDPLLAQTLFRHAQTSQQWMLAAAGIHHPGLGGAVAIQGAVLVYVDALRVFLDDDDPGLARTMAALDRSLQRGERIMRLVTEACAILPRRRTAGDGRGVADKAG